MITAIDGPIRDPGGLDGLAPLWRQLHAHHRLVADYGPLVDDVDASWTSRRAWYERLLAGDAFYLLATDPSGVVIGYAMCEAVRGDDDTFLVRGGILEVVSLVVDDGHRNQGIGRRLLAAIEEVATEQGLNTLKVAVMAGNAGASHFYSTTGFALGEHVLYKRLAL
jgi:GNAT superfamily N-acetyltransferase